jgi:hypothetical protein
MNIMFMKGWACSLFLNPFRSYVEPHWTI